MMSWFPLHMHTASAPQATTRSSQRFSAGRVRLALVASVLAVTFLVYLGTVRFEFVLDDNFLILHDPGIRSWRNLPHLFQLHWGNVSNPTTSYYRPVFGVWSLANYQMFGPNPALWHVGNIVLHLLATTLVFYLARRLLKSDFGAAIAALIFGVHPIHVESVAWVTGATDVLLTVLCLASFLAHLRFRDHGERRWWWLGAALLLYGLACLVKEPAAVLVALVASFEWLFAPAARMRDKIRRSAGVVSSFVAVAAGYFALRFSILHGIGHQPLALPAWKVPLSWPELLWFYIHKIVWPTRLALFYHVQYLLTPDVRHFWIPLLLVAISAAGVVVAIRRLPVQSDDEASPRAVAWFGVVWFLASLAPVLDVFPLQPEELAHDRYLYLPSVGFAVLAALAIRRINFGKARLFGAPAAQIAVLVAVTASMASGAVRQSVYWGNDLLVHYRAIEITPDSPSALRGLGDSLFARGYIEEGIRMHEQLLRRYPDFWRSHVELGDAYFKLGWYAESEQHMREAVRLNPSAPLFVYLAAAQMKNQHYAGAESSLRQAIAAEPATVG